MISSLFNDHRLQVSVCLSVREDISGTTHAIFVHVASVRGSVLVWQGDEIPRTEAVWGGGFFPVDNA